MVYGLWFVIFDGWECFGSMHVPLRKSDAWIKRDLVAGDRIVKIHVALKQHNLLELERLALAVSDPDSSLYGQHLSNEQVSQLIALPSDAVSTVRDWIHGTRPYEQTRNIQPQSFKQPSV